MKSMSPGPSDVRRPTRSPGFSSTGPEVVRSWTPISRAMSMASVVLPRPGGPKNSVWSSVSRRPLAASIAICSELFTCSCPTNSSSRDGRSAASAPVSSGRGSGVVTCSLFISGFIPGQELASLLYFTTKSRRYTKKNTIVLPLFFVFLRVLRAFVVKGPHDLRRRRRHELHRLIVQPRVPAHRPLVRLDDVPRAAVIAAVAGLGAVGGHQLAIGASAA